MHILRIDGGQIRVCESANRVIEKVGINEEKMQIKSDANAYPYNNWFALFSKGTWQCASKFGICGLEYQSISQGQRKFNFCLAYEIHLEKRQIAF